MAWTDGDPESPEPAGRGGASGRRFVLLAVAALLVAWCAVYLSFRAWRDRYRDLRDFGRREVSAAIDPLARVVPTGLDAGEWSAMVARTHELLDDLVGAGLLDRPGLIALRDDLRRRVVAARPGSAESTLIRLWSDLESKAGPSIARRPPPDRIALALAIEPLRKSPPPDLNPADWALALDDAESLLVRLAASDRPDAPLRSTLLARWSSSVSRADPRSSRSILRAILDEANGRLRALPHSDSEG